MQNSFMNIEHVRALAAAVDEGTVEGAAFVLRITPSAASQRIRALESRLGQVLIRRTNPITVTEAQPTPNAFCHNIVGFLKSNRQVFSCEIPLPRGPRHCGQSAATAPVGT